MRTSSIFNSQHVATRCNSVAKRVQHVAPNNVAICCIQMLWLFGQYMQMLGQQCCDLLHSNVVFVWPGLANTGPTMLRYVALRCCYHLAGASCNFYKWCVKNLNIFKFKPTTPNMSQHIPTRRNMVAKRTPHVAPNNVAILWPGFYDACFTFLESCTRQKTYYSFHLFSSA